MRFLHTADWQMGMKAAHAGASAARVREARFDSANAIADLALAESVDFVLIAGDTFEDHSVSDDVVRRTAGVLNRMAPIPVYVLPGNHDPHVAGGVWDRQGWRQAGPHVRLLTDSAEIVPLPGVALYPCPARQKKSEVDPTALIPVRAPDDCRIRIGIAHGSLPIRTETNFPIAAHRASICGLDYLALGDWHSYHAGLHNAYYPGTHEQTSYADADAGWSLIVTIDRAGVQVDRRRVGKLRWGEFSVAIGDLDDIETLRNRLQALAPLENCLVRVAASLTSSEENVAQGMASLCDELRQKAIALDWSQSITPEALREADLDDGLFRMIDEALLARSSGAAGEDSDVVLEARTLLRRIAAGGQL